MQKGSLLKNADEKYTKLTKNLCTKFTLGLTVVQNNLFYMKRLRGAYDSVGIVYPTYADRKKLLIQSNCLETFKFQGLLSI